ncbi:MAG: hypothetical protein Q4F78_04195 [Bacillota bacterium]|nr:hypothetical protein [Bacillota bacterium]
MEKKKMKKLLLTAGCTAALLVSSTAMCFADEATTPVHVNLASTAVDFEITEKIDMVGSANSTDLTVDSMEVTNLSQIGVLNIDSIEVDAEDSWEVVSMTTDFSKLAADSNKFGLMADSEHDMTAAYTGAGTVDPGATDTTTFTGKTGMVKSSVSDKKVADMIVTVSYK